MVAAEQARLTALRGYSGLRQYVVETKRIHFRASMKVEVRVDATGAKSFKIVEMQGPAPVRKLVFQRMLDTETKASERAAQVTTRISPANYELRFVETREDRGRSCHVFEATPRSNNKLLFRGRIWVDSEEYAVTRIEASPAQKPSWWVNRTQFVHQYHKVGNQWLALSNHSETDVKVFGQTHVSIEYSAYRMDDVEDHSADK